jgi:hypothetical protein
MGTTIFNIITALGTIGTFITGNATVTDTVLK